jgi:hypothetical protein
MPATTSGEPLVSRLGSQPRISAAHDVPTKPLTPKNLSVRRAIYTIAQISTRVRLHDGWMKCRPSRSVVRDFAMKRRSLEEREELLERFERWTEWPLTVLALILIPILLGPYVLSLSAETRDTLEQLDYAI